MEAKKVKENEWVVRIARGEKLVASLADFCVRKRIEGGFFFGVGAVDEAELAHYDVGKKKYSAKKFKQPLEMVSLSGSIGKEKELIVHAHAVFADPDMQTLGGHLIEATVSGTAEIYLIPLPALAKKYDEETGLKIFNLS